MKSILTFMLTVLITLATTAQKKVTTKSGVLKFEASTENFEPVVAINKTTSAILKEDGSLAVLGLIKGFQFKKKLMQEHFNQKKFMDSEQFPKAKFAGTLADYKGEDGKYTVTGNLTIHGVTKEVTTMATIKNVDSTVYLHTKFTVLVADYGINVKSKLTKKIAEKVIIEIDLELK
ncbi:MAG: YceI family protein [Flavobacteriaceae bacterium]|nr:YceI family protein [Flavobacteriaceae bacterium]